MNKKGFTVVELLASFTLTMIIMVFLFEIVLELKDVYVTNALKEKILEKNALIATKLTKDLNEVNVAYATCPNIASNCVFAGYSNNYSVTISDNQVSFKNETTEKAMTIKMPEKVTISDISMETESPDPFSPNDNAYVKISYKAKNSSLKKEIEFNYVYTFHQDNFDQGF